MKTGPPGRENGTRAKILPFASLARKNTSDQPLVGPIGRMQIVIPQEMPTRSGEGPDRLTGGLS